MSANHGQRLTEAAQILRSAEQPLRVTRLLNWPKRVTTRFFERHGRDLPRLAGLNFDPGPTLEAVQAARRLLHGGDLGVRWLRKQARAIELTAQMLACCGTRDFFRYSGVLYGVPTTPLMDGAVNTLDLAKRLDRILGRLDHGDLGVLPATVTAEEVATRIRTASRGVFGEQAPEVLVVDRLSARATASPSQIKIRSSANFTDADARQLIEHEAMVHVATALNGKAQRHLPILASGHAGTTRTQEGLAVFSEVISGTMAPERLRRLANRVLAIQMSIDGANFLEVYRFFLNHSDDPGESFEDAKRIFRGGLLEGRGPFTKDGVYLDGLVRVHNFMRRLVEMHRAELLPLLFVGKLDLEDIPALAQLTRQGLCKPPRFMPSWATDRRFLISYLVYSSFLNRIPLGEVRTHYGQLMSDSWLLPHES